MCYYDYDLCDINVYMKFVSCSQSLLPGGNSALAQHSRDIVALAALSPLQESDGHDADEEDHSSHQTTAARAAEGLFHVGEPEGTDETPSGADDVDEDANAGAVLDHAIDGVGDKDGSDDLVANGRDGDADLGCELVVSLTRRL